MRPAARRACSRQRWPARARRAGGARARTALRDVRDRRAGRSGQLARRRRAGRATRLESTIRRSQTWTSSSATGSRTAGARASAGRPADRDEQRARRCSPERRPRAAEVELDHLRGDVPALLARAGRRARETLRVDPVLGVGLGKEQDRARGMAPPRPASVSTAASTHSFGTHAMCVITLVRRSGPRFAADSVAQPARAALRRRRQRRRPRRATRRRGRRRRSMPQPLPCPSRRISSSAAAGPHVPAA